MIVFMDLAYKLGLFYEERKYFADLFHHFHQRNTSDKADDNAMYSTLEVLITIYVCNELRQYVGQFAYMMTDRVQDSPWNKSSI